MDKNQTTPQFQRQPTIEFWKNEGETPLECLTRLRMEEPLYAHSTLSYAGRLDPIAEGVLLVLVGEENKNREKYLGLDKEYEVEVLLGLRTDTGDILGKVVEVSKGPQEKISEDELSEVLKSFIGKFDQPYPHYSSKTVSGKPLFQWAREGKLDEIEIPERSSEIYLIGLLDASEMRGKDILKQAIGRISKVKGDFRQGEIVNSWQENLLQADQASFQAFKMKVSCSSGTYMRTLAEKIAEKMGMFGVAWSIKRTKIFK